MLDYISINKKLWDERVGIHLNSDFYDKDSFMKGKLSLSGIEQDLLGKIKGKTILHLQCHFGMDTISLSRMGSIATGIDFSDKAITSAKQLALETGENTEFFCSDIYDLPSVLQNKFQIVFTSFGAIGWLPDLNKWAQIIRQFLKPGGKFILAEFHPVVWMFDSHFGRIQYRYFKSEAIVEIEKGTYADKEADLNLESVTWNHSLSEVMQSLIYNGIEIVDFQEYDYSPHNCFEGTVEVTPGHYCIKALENKIPMSYSIVGVKKI